MNLQVKLLHQVILNVTKIYKKEQEEKHLPLYVYINISPKNVPIY